MAKSGSSEQTSLPLELGGDGLASAQPISVRLTGGKPARTLTRNQKKFGKLLKEVEKLRARHDRVTKIWEAFLQAYRERIHPKEQRQHELRKRVVRLLSEHSRGHSRLGPRQREALFDLIESQLGLIFDHEPDLTDADLLDLRKHFADRAARFRSDSPADDDDDDAGHLPPPIAEMIRTAGLDPKRFHAGMTEDDFVEEMQRQLHENGMSEDIPFEDIFDVPPPVSRKQKSKSTDPRRTAEQAEDARKRTIGVIYKQLAKVLHPDLEPDPGEREKKHHLMQELTEAYKQGDLHTLLRLELSWIHREEGDIDHLTDEKLKIYIELLHEQVANIAHSPRFAAVGRFANPFTGEPDPAESILANLRPYTDSLRATITGFEGSEPNQHLRELARDYIQQRKNAARRLDDFTGFDVF